jgi:hypothetical protein
MPSKCQALSSNPSTAKKQNENSSDFVLLIHQTENCIAVSISRANTIEEKDKRYNIVLAICPLTECT